VTALRTALGLSLGIAILLGGCSGEVRFPLTPEDPGPVVPPGPNDECGTLHSGSFTVNRSRPIRSLFTQAFPNAVSGRMFVQINQFESDTNLRFVAVSVADETTLIIHPPGNSCGVLADTTASDTLLTRYAGEVTLSAGTWTFYADHASRVECWKDEDSGPVNVIDAHFQWCEQGP
jgi:hypothetical protein